MDNQKEIVVYGNDAVCGGKIEITYNRGASVSPLHLDFEREDGYKCSMSLNHSAVRELLKLIVNNI